MRKEKVARPNEESWCAGIRIQAAGIGSDNGAQRCEDDELCRDTVTHLVARTIAKFTNRCLAKVSVRGSEEIGDNLALRDFVLIIDLKRKGYVAAITTDTGSKRNDVILTPTVRALRRLRTEFHPFEVPAHDVIDHTADRIRSIDRRCTVK